MAIQYFLSTLVNSATALIANGDMEVDSNWALHDPDTVGGSHYLANSYFTQGSYSRLVQAAGWGVGIVSDPYEVVVGQQYILNLSAYPYAAPSAVNSIALYSDNFTGSSGSDPNTDLWTTYEPSVSNVWIQSNALECYASGVGVHAQARSVFSVAGDFVVEVDFNITYPANTNTPQWFAGLRVVNGDDATDFYQVVRSYYSTYEYRAMKSEDGALSTINTVNISDILSGKFKIEKAGTVFAGYYYSGGAWVPFASTYTPPAWGDTTKVYLVLWTNNQTTRFSFDNLAVYQVEAVSVSDAQRSCRLQVTDGASADLAYDGQYILPTSQWTHITAEFVETAGGPNARLAFTHAGSQAAVYHVDNIVLSVVTSYTVQLRPEPDAVVEHQIIKDEHRTAGGNLYQYKWGDYVRAKLPCKYLAAEKASLINSWWAADQKVLLMINSGGAWQVDSVVFENKRVPFAEYVKPYTRYMQGVIELRGY